MATPILVPRADSEGGLGSATKYWASAYIDTITTTGNVDINGNLTVEDKIELTDGGTTVRGKLMLNASDTDNVELRAESLGSTMKFFTVGTEALELDASQNATFAGTINGIPFSTDATNKSMYTTTTPSANNAVQNTAYGFSAMEDITTGDYNTAMGYNSSANFTTGAQNVSIGAYALGLAVTAASNVAVG